MATSSSTSSSTSSALTEVVAQPRIETRRTISSYDLTSGDNPGTLISKLLLLGPNYDEWANNLKLALKARKKFGFVDGTIPQPTEDDVDFEDWTANNTLVISWIRLTIDDSLSSSLSHVNDSNELWIHIQKRFGVKNGQRVQRHKTELANCRQKGLAIEAYYGKLTQLWGSLADYQRAKKMEEVRKEREEDKLHQFLMGLDDTLYGAVKSNLLSRIPLPSLEEAYNALTMDEEAKQLSQDNEGRADGVSFAVQTTPSRKPFDNRAVCNICGRTRHIADNCFRKIGYPEWWGENPKSNSNFRNKQGNNSGKGNSNYGGAGRGTCRFCWFSHRKELELSSCEQCLHVKLKRLSTLWTDHGYVTNILTILDDFSRAVWIYLLPSKQEAPTHLKKILALVERQFSTKVKTVRSDNGSEFICLKDFFAQQGIIHETSYVGTPQQNGRVERKHRHILNGALLFNSRKSTG
ncbi:Integrase catalytic core [Arabidopsis thaliana x Arabidopsis arenosa]|uniref:Integrase catalytic core n=1 Tax=Arabidopsis thaliana x Arabidopsis arenosa TaxID=1240361 RepID=A0A8T2B0P1_9BRAS|nr:Integrase catalytic core [Arabidopsis thaliana x Arabidopsis arenosa]